MDRIFEAYEGIGFGLAFKRKTHERLHWTLSRVADAKMVLDVGCSQGIGPILLGRMGIRAQGIDVNAEALSFAEEKLTHESQSVQDLVSFARINFLAVQPEKGMLDAIVIGEVLEHLVSPEQFIEKAFSLLRESGTLVVTVPFGINDDPDHRQTFYLTRLYRMLHPCFAVREVKFFDGWIGFVSTRRTKKIATAATIPDELFEKAEKAFFAIERPLRDAVATGKDALMKERDAVAAKVSEITKAKQDGATALAKLKTENAEVIKKLNGDFATANKVVADLTARVKAAESALAAKTAAAQKIDQERNQLLAEVEKQKRDASAQNEQMTLMKAALQFAQMKANAANDDTKLIECRKDLDDLRQELREAQEDRIRRMDELTALKVDAEVSRANLRFAQSSLDEERKSHASARETVTKLTAAKAAADAEVARQKEVVSQLTAEKAAAEENAVRQCEAVAELQKRLAGEIEWSCQHKKENDALQAEFAKVSSSTRDLQAKVRGLVDEGEKLKKAHASEKALHVKFSADAYKLGKQVEDLRKRLEFEIRRSDGLKEERDALVAELEQLKKAHASEKAAHVKFSAEAYRNGNAVRRLEKRISSLKDRRDSLKKKVKRLSAAYKALSRAKLGRLTLRYWKFKDGLKRRFRFSGGGKGGSARRLAPAQADAAAWNSQRQNEERYFAKV